MVPVPPTGPASMTEAITYDDMGNIKTLKRDAGVVTTYAYTGNKLTGLTGGVSGTYTYDANGNATKDRTLTTLSYNYYLNLPQTATKTSTSVRLASSLKIIQFVFCLFRKRISHFAKLMTSQIRIFQLEIRLDLKSSFT